MPDPVPQPDPAPAEEQTGWLQKALIHGVQGGINRLLPDPADGTDTEPEEPGDRLRQFAQRVLADEATQERVGAFAAERVKEQVVEFGTRLKENTGEVLDSLANRFDPDQQNSYELIRNRIAPRGGILRTIAARGLWVGAKIGTFVAAIVVDGFTGRREAGNNRPYIERIIAGLLGRRAPIVEEDEERRNAMLQARRDQQDAATQRVGHATLPQAWQGTTA